MDQVCRDSVPLRIARRHARPVIMLSEKDYEGLVETLHLLSSPANAARLMRSVAIESRNARSRNAGR